MDTPENKDHYWVPFPSPTTVQGVEDVCKWLNYMDGILTAHALTQGSAVELNFFMRKAWETSPLVYAMVKWWLFWLGLNLLEKSILTSATDEGHTRGKLLKFVLGVFSMVLVWHVIILRFPH